MAARKKRGLGRGLDALLGDDAGTPVASAGETLRDLPVEVLQPGQYQPRQQIDNGKLEELAASIEAQGMVQPIIVRAVGDERFEIIAGERRWRAAQLAKLREVPVLVRDVPDRTAIAMALIENIQREDLNPLEEAAALQRLIDEFELTHAEAAKAVGRSRASVSNLLRLMELDEDVRTLLSDGRIEMGHARALLGLEPPQQRSAALRVVQKKLTVRQTETVVRDLLNPPAAEADDGSGQREIQALEQRLTESLCAPVKVNHRKNGAGTMTIKYTTTDELDGILERLGVGAG